MINQTFEDYYETQYGSRWPGLRMSLLNKKPPMAYSKGLIKPYFLDEASIFAAEALDINDTAEENSVLDACAGPGGKSLVLASKIYNTSNTQHLFCNELSAVRRQRLIATLDEHLPADIRERISVLPFDAASMCRKKQNRFAAILLDAPCSSEAHVIASPKDYKRWQPARPKFLAQRQWALLSSAFLMLQEGGSLVYSTCAITSEENDGVAKRLMQKYAEQCTLEKPVIPSAEENQFGVILLPDTSGIGPMYIARFRKKSHA
ncbi:MAG: 16S rRNA methyltransferase [Spirochaetaceae bacterium]|jgi:16S rRNA (cytosine1407-C5)-methyltransferase|nr:16S rRNA methyltransferase [Spirochaetaceae bacterium]